jgi:hypothetical protein
MNMLDELKAAADNLRAAIAEHNRAENATIAPEVLPPGITPDMPQKSKDEANRLYLESIMQKAPGLITPDERRYLHAAIQEFNNDGRSH